MSVRARQPGEPVLLGLGMYQKIPPLFCWLGCSRSSSGKGGGRCAAGAWGGRKQLGITQATLALCLIDVCRGFCGEIQYTDKTGSGYFLRHAEPGCMAYMSNENCLLMVELQSQFSCIIFHCCSIKNSI